MAAIVTSAAASFARRLARRLAMQRLEPLPWQLAAFIAIISSLHCAADAKTVMGIADGLDYDLVTNFCFVFPRGSSPLSSGRIHSQTIVSSDGHKFLVVNQSDYDRGLPCEELVRKAKVMEPLSERTAEVVAYDLTLNVEPSMHGQQVAAVIARCGQRVRAEYIVEFTNPGNDWQQHFACSEQTLIDTYFCFSAAALGLAALLWRAHAVLQRRQAHNEVSALFFAGIGFSLARVVLFTAHVAVYARNGIGLGMLLFVAQFLDFAGTTMSALSLLAVAHGVYVTRPCVPHGSAERKTLTQVVGAFAGTSLLTTLICGFRSDMLLDPLGALSGGAAWPHLLARAGTAVYCLNRGLQLAASQEAAHKKQHILWFTFAGFAWLLSVPVVVLLTPASSWSSAAFLIEAANLVMAALVLREMWPDRFGALFSCPIATERKHPYSEFGLQD